MGSSIQNFTDLIVWQKAILLAKHVYTLTRGFPAEERFGLTLQMRRAAVSISSNIAEGHARRGREFSRFLSIARGSAAEVQSQLLLSVELGFANQPEAQPALDVLMEVAKMLATLSRRVDSAADPAP